MSKLDELLLAGVIEHQPKYVADSLGEWFDGFNTASDMLKTRHCAVQEWYKQLSPLDRTLASELTQASPIQVKLEFDQKQTQVQVSFVVTDAEFGFTTLEQREWLAVASLYEEFGTLGIMAWTEHRHGKKRSRSTIPSVQSALDTYQTALERARQF